MRNAPPSCGGIFDFDVKSERLAVVSRELEDPKIWDSPERAQALGKEKKELEGVFIVKDGRAVFQPLKVGIAGDKFFEVVDGLKEGDQVITGPFASMRAMKDGDQVKISTAPPPAAKK